MSSFRLRVVILASQWTNMNRTGTSFWSNIPSPVCRVLRSSNSAACRSFLEFSCLPLVPRNPLSVVATTLRSFQTLSESIRIPTLGKQIYMESEPKVELESDYEQEEDPEIWQQRGQMDPQDLRLYLVRRTVLEMLRDRGYQISDMEIAMSKADFVEKFGSNIKRTELELVRPKIANLTEQIFVFFPEELNVGVTAMKRYVEIMNMHKVKLAIIVVQRKLTLYGRQCISEMSGKYRIESFEETELLVNVTDSVMVPVHHVLTDDEKKAILQRFSAKSEQLPRLLENDPVARYYGLRKGQMVKIVRPGQNAADGEAVSYRMLV